MQFGIMNPNGSEGLMDLVSCGHHLVLLVTGRENVTGSAMALRIELTENSGTYRRMEGDVNFDASPVLNGTYTVETLTGHLRRPVIGVVSGHRSRSEALGHKKYFIPYKYREKEVIRPCGK